jgi:predicted transcriptional regulator
MSIEDSIKLINPLKSYLDKELESPHAFARRSGIPFPTIYRIIKNVNRPYRRTAQKIIRATKGGLKLEDFGYE